MYGCDEYRNVYADTDGKLPLTDNGFSNPNAKEYHCEHPEVRVRARARISAHTANVARHAIVLDGSHLCLLVMIHVGADALFHHSQCIKAVT